MKVSILNSNNVSDTVVRSPQRSDPAARKVRSRDRNGWSNYGRNRKKATEKTTPPDAPAAS